MGVVDNWLKNYKIYLGVSNIHGVGLFAIDDIKKGEVVFSYLNNIETIFSNIKKLSISKNKLKVLKRLYFFKEDVIQLKPGGIHFVNFINYNEDPNMEWEYKNKISIYKAKKNIKANEELTLDFLNNKYHKELNFIPNEQKKV